MALTLANLHQKRLCKVRCGVGEDQKMAWFCGGHKEPEPGKSVASDLRFRCISPCCATKPLKLAEEGGCIYKSPSAFENHCGQGRNRKYKETITVIDTAPAGGTNLKLGRWLRVKSAEITHLKPGQKLEIFWPLDGAAHQGTLIHQHVFEEEHVWTVFYDDNKDIEYRLNMAQEYYRLIDEDSVDEDRVEHFFVKHGAEFRKALKLGEEQGESGSDSENNRSQRNAQPSAVKVTSKCRRNIRVTTGGQQKGVAATHGNGAPAASMDTNANAELLADFARHQGISVADSFVDGDSQQVQRRQPGQSDTTPKATAANPNPVADFTPEIMSPPSLPGAPRINRAAASPIDSMDPPSNGGRKRAREMVEQAMKELEDQHEEESRRKTAKLERKITALEANLARTNAALQSSETARIQAVERERQARAAQAASEAACRQAKSDADSLRRGYASLEKGIKEYKEKFAALERILQGQGKPSENSDDSKSDTDK